MRQLRFISTVLILTLLLVLTACGNAATSTELVSASSTENMVEYVGEVSETEFFVAIAVDQAGDVLAYVCNGMGVEYLFHGKVQADTLKLVSDEGQAGLQGTIENSELTGTFSADGKTYSFKTVIAQEYGGLYRVTGLTEFEAEGTSQGGATVKINLTSDKGRVQVVVITPNGSTLSSDRPWRVGHDHSEPTEYGESWVIFLNDGRSHGGHIRTSLKKGVKHIDPICNP